MRWKNVKGKDMRTLKTAHMITQRDKCAAAIRGITDCLRYARLEPSTRKELRKNRDYEEARLVLLDAAIISA